MKAAAALLLPLLLPLLPCSAAPVPYLHMDAAAQRDLRNKSALPPLAPEQAVDLALALRADGSVAAMQSAIVAQRPVFRTDGTAAFLRFDGEDDFLSLAGPRKLSPAATVFIVAAPKANPGFFRGFFALSEFGKNDYTAGLNLDLGPAATDSLSFLNLESAGADGARDLLQPGQNLAADLPFGGFHLFTVRSEIKPAGGEAWIDGLPLAKRDRLESNIGFDQFVLGARYCSNDPAQQPFVGSFLQADIAEVMVFDSALDEKDRKDIEDRLLAKLPALNAFASGKSGHALETVKDAPPVQMLVPGFSVSELPLKLTNRNNLRYRHDGKLVALGYDGTIHLLTDTDGDGLEDKAEVFWDRPTMRGPLGMALLPKGDPRGDGVIVPSKGKVSLILDKDRDGRADEEIIVATGWQEIPQNVDAVGVAVDPKDGSIYFSLGTANYANAYLIDPATGKAAYDLKSERGTIQKVSADFKTRTTVCTGVRFACALGFNREGDLFATEQEGATWLPNGNPLDELLHIQPGKHYGFPPRHPKHLPDVLDWPAVVEYGPQHQSTVGMCFNESVNGGPTFGPEFWAGDAIVCGEARGKLYRTKLVKTPHGYVGQNHLIACLSLLTVDACISPAGDLLVACHSGPPDWGTGPKGEGRLFKIRHTGKQIPQPVWQWASAPDEFRIAFDRELKPEEWAGLTAAAGVPSSGGNNAEQPKISANPSKNSLMDSKSFGGSTPKPELTFQTVGKATPKLEWASQTVGKAILKLEWASQTVGRATPKLELASQTFGKATPKLELASQTFGKATPKLEWAFQTVGKATPKLEWASQTIGEGKPESAFFIQSNSNTGAVLPKRRVRIEAGRHVAAGDRFEVIRPGYQVVRDQMAAPRRDVEVLGLSLSADRRTIIIRVPRQTEPVGYAVTLPLPESWRQESPIPQKPEMDVLVTLNGRPQEFEDAHLIPRDETYLPTLADPFIPVVQPGASLDWKPEPAEAMFHPAEKSVFVRGQTLPLSAAMTRVPWVESGVDTDEVPAGPYLPGHWLAGRRVFFSSEAACYTCHQIRGEGTAVGPDLTNLIHRDHESVLADILKPSASINPDHPASTVTLKSGATLTGIVRHANDKELKVALQAGAVQTLAAADVASTELLKTSLMPEGYADRLTKEQQQDLLKFLLQNPLEPAPVERTDPPPPPARKRAEVEAILRGTEGTEGTKATNRGAPSLESLPSFKSLRILLAAGPKDHGPGEHDYPLWQKRWATLLALAPGVTVDTSWEFPKPQQLAAADVTVFYSKNPGFNPRTAMLLDDYQNRGGGLVYLHWAIEGGEHADILAERMGLASNSKGTRYRHGEFDLVFPQPEHPVTKGFPTLHFTDETYWKLVGDPARINLLGTGVEEGAPQPQLWSIERGKGRVIGCVPGHYTWTFDDPLYRALVLRAICWTAKQEDVDRLAELATVGARIAP